MRSLVLPGVALLGACANAAAQSPYPLRSSAEDFVCRTTALEQFHGQVGSGELAPTILRASGAKTLRWVPHGGVVTMEHSPERVTVWLDAEGRVERVTCG